MFTQISIKHKAFTLIELLVVVAIIGILAAVGVNTFTGFQEKAKISSAKSNHMSIIKYIYAEVIKCDLGDTSVMQGNLNCSSVTGVNIAKAAVDALSDFNNPYKPNQKAVVNYSVGTGADDNAGLIGIVGDGPKSNGFPTTVYVNSCVKIPCNPGENRIHSTLTF